MRACARPFGHIPGYITGLDPSTDLLPSTSAWQDLLGTACTARLGLLVLSEKTDNESGTLHQITLGIATRDFCRAPMTGYYRGRDLPSRAHERSRLTTDRPHSCPLW